MIKLVVFDLDGTLLNTIADLANSTNYALKQNGFPTHDVEEYYYFVGNGINKLFERALPEACRTDADVLRIRQSFLPHYDAHNMDDSSPYPGIPALLETLQQRGILLAVASNKYQAAAERLVAHFFPTCSFVQVLGQREGVPTKPDPTIVHDILRVAGVASEETLYVGDSGVDMATALNSGAVACGVTWGFRPRQELEHFHPAYIVDDPQEILPICSC